MATRTIEKGEEIFVDYDWQKEAQLRCEEPPNIMEKYGANCEDFPHRKKVPRREERKK